MPTAMSGRACRAAMCCRVTRCACSDRVSSDSQRAVDYNEPGVNEVLSIAIRGAGTRTIRSAAVFVGVGELS